MDRSEKRKTASELFEALSRFVPLAHEAMSRPLELATGQTISRADMEALRLIRSAPGVTVTEGADKLRRTCGTMSLRAAKLEKDGLIRRGKEAGSDRLRHLHLTEPGAEVFESVVEHEQDEARQFLEKLLSSFSPEEIGALIRMLEFISSDLTEKLESD